MSLRWFVVVLVSLSVSVLSAEEPIRIGLIGLDTSHVIAFTKLINNSDDPKHVPGGRVVAAYPGGSHDIESSYTRIDGFTEQLKTEFGVEIVSTIEELCTKVDAVMLTSVDGRPHLAQARPVFAAGLPLYIDKPMAGSLRDVLAIFALAEETGTPCFTSSAYRFYDSLTALRAKDMGEVRGAISFGPAHLEPTHPDLFWYAVHPVEALFTVMGTGCESVVRVHTADTDVVTGVWSGGRVGTLRGLRNQATPHGVIVFGTKSVAQQEGGGDYAPLVAEIMKFFQTKVAPVNPAETIEMFAFMEAADESKRRGGAPVTLREVIDAASDD